MLHLAFAFLLLASDPSTAHSLLKKGLLALQHGDLTEARQDLERASSLDDKNAYVWTSLSQVYLRCGDREKALKAAAEAEELAPANPTLLHALAIFYAEANDPPKAFALAQQAEQKQDSRSNRELVGSIAFPYAQALLQKEDFTTALNVLTAALQVQPNDAQLVLAMGVTQYGQRRFDDAIASFLKVIHIDPSIPQSYLFLSRMLDQAGPRLAEITADFEVWASKNPANAAAQLELAKALLEADPHSARAGELVRKSIALDSANWESHYELGVFLEDKHQYPDAGAEFTRSIELNPNQPMTHYHLARVYDRLGQPEKAKSEREIHHRLTANPPAKSGMN